MTPNYSILSHSELLQVAYGLWGQVEELRKVAAMNDGYENWTPGMKLEPGDKVRIVGEVVRIGGPSRIKSVWVKSKTVRSWLWKYAKMIIVCFFAYIIPYAIGALHDDIDVNKMDLFPLFMFFGGAIYEMYLEKANSRKEVNQ